MDFDFSITSLKPLSKLVKNHGLSTWKEVVDYTKHLSYGRNTNRTDFSLVIKEGKGSCSSKHAFLKALAKENSIDEVELILAIYKMNSTNTKVGTIINDNGLAYIPEAHCYLKVKVERLDITASDSNFTKLQKAIIEEQTITSEQVADFKIQYHKQFIKNWILETEIGFSFETIWQIREACIAFLSV
ncbi:hypothetical protein BTO06_12675 [Tenacibaculum sp. SZ-18]|uniref:hypothetical protein n=1 Tax=Tenacibaculum sp. SZ-18 TaxID=754423 RepID=UPI000CA28C64|nr:hypothetical protein [Tenacibaculum sp. SZ-18]AUC15953.1 hypothetical protein BTO06_12675 [Tenacibaculum sp. SZ-18]